MSAAARAGSAVDDRALSRAGGEHYLTTAELAAELRRSAGTVRQWRYLGVGPAFIPGGRVLYARSDVDAWLAAQRAT